MTRAPRLFLTVLLLCALVAGASAYTLDGEVFARGYAHALGGISGTTLYNYEVPFVISNQTGVPSGTTLYTNGTTNKDWSDIRFTDTSLTRYSYWIESQDATSCLVWVNVSVIPETGKTVWFFYDADGAISRANGRYTFPMYSEFINATVNTSIWTDFGGCVQGPSEGGILTATADDASWHGIRSIKTFGRNYALRARAQVPSTDVMLGWFDPNSAANTVARYEGLTAGDRSYTKATGNEYTTAPFSGSWSTFEIIRNGSTNVVFEVNDTVYGTHIAQVPNANGNFNIVVEGAGNWVKADWFFIRPYVYPEPSHGSYVLMATLPEASFTANATIGADPLAVQFTSTAANATAWAWDFDEDGFTDSADPDPVCVFSGAGAYTVTLTVSNAAGADTETKADYIVVNPAEGAPVAEFSANVTSGTAPLLVGFTSTSTNATDWSWDFDGDGGADGGGESVIYIYANPGLYTVVLNASGQGGFDTETKIDYITVTAPGVVTPPPTTVAPTGFTALSETHGTTWIRWTWSPAVNLSANQTLVGVYDGLEVFNVTSNATIPPEMYYRGDLNPNEYHLFGLVLVNATDGNQTTTSIDLGVTTAQGAEFFYIIFVVALALALVGAIIPNRYMALVLLMFAFLLSAYLAIGTTASNASFSVIAVMMAVVTALGMIFVVYDLVKSHVSWENDDY